jgi:uncharacterized protein
MLLMKKLLRRTALTALTLVALAFIGTAIWGSGRLVHPHRRALMDYHREIQAAPDQFGLKIEPYTGPASTPCLLLSPSALPGEAKKGQLVRQLLTKRGIQLAPWGQLRGTLVLLHGYSGRKEDYFPVAERFCAAGFRCIVIDLPGHGENPATTATFGKNEVQLVESVLDDAAGRFHFSPTHCGLFGLSQGGAIALQAAARPGSRWSAIASVSAFASLDQPVRYSANQISPMLTKISAFTTAACACGVHCRVGFFPSEIQPVSAAKSIQIPAFIAHGDQDDFIPIRSGEEIFNAIPTTDKSFHPIHGAGHHNVLSTGSHELYADICEFFLAHCEP